MMTIIFIALGLLLWTIVGSVSARAIAPKVWAAELEDHPNDTKTARAHVRQKSIATAIGWPVVLPYMLTINPIMALDPTKAQRELEASRVKLNELEARSKILERENVTHCLVCREETSGESVDCSKAIHNGDEGTCKTYDVKYVVTSRGLINKHTDRVIEFDDQTGKFIDTTNSRDKLLMAQTRVKEIEERLKKKQVEIDNYKELYYNRYR